MHMGQTTGSQITGTPSGDGSCCRASSLPESAVKPVATTQVTSTVQPAAALTVVSVVPCTLAFSEDPPEPVTTSGGSPQAVLCTFLV
jgi:hypothetical protein